MPLQIDLTKDLPADADLVLDPVTRERVGEVEGAAAAGFTGDLGQVLHQPGRLLVGAGPSAAVDDAVVRRIAAIAARAAARVEHLAVPNPGPGRHQAAAEGLGLGHYAFRDYKSTGEPSRLQRVTVAGGGGARAEAALATGMRIAEAVNVARDLVNEPAGNLYASTFAARATDLGEANGFRVDVLDEKGIRKRGFTGLLAVNRGSTHPPRFLELTYEPAGGAKATVALVGKGITFDSGGLSMKTAEGMMWMKDDMGGAAAVLGAVSACRDLGVKVRVRGFLPLTDNMTGGDAQRVGDVIRYANGTTVEVLNTDAEGRLILADALIAASAERPNAIVDVATLTGACAVALGPKYAGAMGDHQGWMAQVLAAGATADEGVWQLPLVEAYRRDLDSKTADLKNIGGKWGGAITAGLFLREFVGAGIPWVHLDIAGAAFNEGAEEGIDPPGGTGFGVRTLLQLLRSYKRP